MDRIEKDSIIDGRYRVVSRIGSGGMADVYWAEDTELGRPVALKLLHQRFAEDEEFVERFRREASSAAGLQHPNVVQVFDRGQWQGTYYIAMEYLDGRSLKQLITEQGPLAPDQAIDIVVQVLRAARFAHRRGIIHRDFKPHNVIVDEEGRAKVTDFGIARAGPSDMTETGSILGTAHYLSPEQAQGHAVEHHSDLYSIGIMLYEALTGRVPFAGESAVSIALKHVSEQPLPPRQYNTAISPELEAVVLRAIAKLPAERFGSADEFIGALEAVRGLPGAPLAEAPPTEIVAAADPVVEEFSEGSRWWIPLLVLALLAALGLAAFFLLRPHTAPVPNVIGSSTGAATQILAKHGFAASVQHASSDTVPNDRVASQNPSPNTKAKKGSKVTIVVSSGPGVVLVPTVANARRGQAEAALQTAGFTVVVQQQPSDTVSRGLVIDTEPPQGSKLQRGSTVTLLVSSGPAKVDVPNVVSLPIQQAQNELTGAGFKPVVSEKESTDATPGTVLAQNPISGASRSKGATVTLTVAKAPAARPVPNVIGSPVDQAINTLTTAGFKVQTKSQPVPTTTQDGVVIKQAPPAKSKRTSGAQIIIYVGRFTPNMTPTPAPSTSP